MTINSNQADSLAGAPTYKGLLASVIVFGALYAFYEFWVVAQPVYKEYLEFCVSLASWILNEFLGEQSTIANMSAGMRLELRSHDAAYIRVTKGSDGGLFAVVLIAILAGQSSVWYKTLLGMVIGIALVFCLSIARICVLFKVDIYSARHLYLMSDFILPGVFCLLIALYYFAWLRVSSK